MTTPIDRRAHKILFDTYWTPAGWRDDESYLTSTEDFEYAKSQGVMFDPIEVSHAGIVEEAIGASQPIDRLNVANAFLVSLSTRRLDLRSALGSFAVLQHFPRHEAPKPGKECRVCGVYNHGATLEDLNILNFERFKWGGVRHLDPLYASMDLKQFRELPAVTPSPPDLMIFDNVLTAIEAAPSGTSAASLEKHMKDTFKSNKPEREIVIGILGLCGILATDRHPGFMRQFVHSSDRLLPGRRYVDMEYPACWWQRPDGINQDALTYWFGHVRGREISVRE